MRGGPTGFIGIADNRAQAVYQVASRLGLEIGGDVAMIGNYNTVSWSQMLHPGLTSIAVGEEELARKLAELLRSGAHGEEIRIAPSLVVRESTHGRN